MTSTAPVANSEIPKLVLDPNTDQQLLDQFYQRTLAASGGNLTDTSPGSVLAAIGEGVTFSVAELLYYLNMLPEALALEVLRLSGVSRRLGTKASGTLTFMLTTRLASNFVVPSGYVVPFTPSGYRGTGSIGYVLTQTLTIPAGSLEGSVNVQATDIGPEFNLPKFGVAIANPGFNYCQSVYNPEAITGGSDLESLESTIARSQLVLRSRDVLVSVTDYEQKAVDLLGSGYAKVIPFLSADRNTKAAGQLHVFLLDGSSTQPSAATCQTVQAQLQALSFAASRVWVSPVAFYPCKVEVVLTGSLSQDLVRDIQAAIVAYTNPASLGIGEAIRIKRLEYSIQQVYGVTELVSCLVNAAPLNVPMPNGYTAPQITSIVISITDATGASQTYFRGTGSEDRD